MSPTKRRLSFVNLDGKPVSCRSDCMDELGLKKGQAINHEAFLKILKWNIAACENAIIEKKIKESAPR